MSSYWLRFLAEPLAIDLVDGSEVVHVGEEDVDLDDLLEARAGLLQHGFKVAEDLVLKETCSGQS